MSWRDRWDEAAVEERLVMERTPVDDLLLQAASGRYGAYHQIWYVLARAAGLRRVARVFLRVLEDESDPLPRYHCAAALLELLEGSAITPAELSARPGGVGDSLTRLRGELEKRLGPAPGPGESA